MILADRARFHLRNARWVGVPTMHGLIHGLHLRAGEDGRAATPSVLIAHGWTSEASFFMAVFAEQLRRNGFRVVAFDQPAHGKSSPASGASPHRLRPRPARRGGNPARTYPFRRRPFHGMPRLPVAGEGAAPMAQAYPFERYVLVSPPNRFTDITREFSEELGPQARGPARL